MMCENNNTINSKAPSIDFVYSEYLQGRYLVNRRYQRKLVWTIDEKRAFIDSLFRRYSVPILLFAKNKSKAKEDNRLEIIDGLQRLNAIFSFMENEFGLFDENRQECFFDLQTLGTTKGRLDAGKLQQKEPTIDIEKCRNFTQYPLPISEFSADNASIEEVFRRINSYGRKLSLQEIRQAGSLCKFSDIVRIIASKIRGDVSTTDILPLESMSAISLSNVSLSYGINIRNIFWVKQNIIPEYNIRISRDEELVASTLIFILLGGDVNPSANNLDKLYQYDPLNIDALSTQADDSLLKLGFDNVVKYYIQTYDLIQSTIDNTDVDFRELIFGKKNGERMFRSFQVVFLAIYELFINQDLRSVDKNKLLNKLKNVGANHLKGIGESDWSGSYRSQMIEAIKAIIRPAFSRLKGEDVSRENWTTQLENLLTKSQTEGTQYDFKMGFHKLTKDAPFDEDLVLKCVKLLTAMVNKGPNIKGYIIIGVCENGVEKYKTFYNSVPKQSANTKFYVNGVQDEVEKYHAGNFDNYERLIKKAINKAHVNEAIKLYINQHLKNIEYYGKSVIVMELEVQDGPALYEDKVFVRSGNDLQEVNGYKSLMAIHQRFQ